MRSRRTWKARMAAVLSAAMILNLCAPGFAMTQEQGMESGSYVASGSEATGPEETLSVTPESVPEEVKSTGSEAMLAERLAVQYEVTPEGTAELTKQPEEVGYGKDLSFRVKPEKGWTFEHVMANGVELDGKKTWFGLGSSYSFTVENVEEDQYIEIVMAEADTLKELSQEYDGVTVTVKELEVGALSGITELRVTDTEAYTEAVAAEIEASLAEGESIASYAAYDIALIDENGAEVEPGKNVSVSISGVSPEAEVEYERVNVYHLTEEHQSLLARARRMLTPAAADAEVSGETGSTAYAVEQVASNTKADLEETGEITFTAGEFSPYVVVFVSATHNARVNFAVMAKDAKGNVYEIKNDDAFKDVLALAVTTESTNIEQMVKGFQVNELRATHHRNNATEEWTAYDANNMPVYAYQYASSDSEGEVRVGGISLDSEGNILLDEVQIGDEKTVYLWYTELNDLEIPVIVHFAENREGGATLAEFAYKIGGGKFYDDNGNATDLVMDILNSEEAKAAMPDGWDLESTAFAAARLRDTQGADEWDLANIVSVSKDGDHIYARTEEGREVVMFGSDDSNSVEIHLFFVKGYVLNIVAEGELDDPDNKINGYAVSELGDGGIRIVAVGSTNVNLAVDIAEGYNIRVVSGTDRLDYNSSTEVTPRRRYEVGIPITNVEKNVVVTFSKANKVFDYGFIYRANQTYSSFHASNLKIKIGENGQEQNLLTGNSGSGDRSVPLGNATSFTLTLETQNRTINSEILSFRLDSFAINGQSLDVPPIDSIVSGVPVSAALNQKIYDQRGSEGGDDAVVAVVESITALYDGSEDSGGGYSTQSKITYTFQFSEVKETLRVTGGNLKSKNNNEMLYRSSTEGVDDVVVWRERLYKMFVEDDDGRDRLGEVGGYGPYHFKGAPNSDRDYADDKDMYSGSFNVGSIRGFKERTFEEVPSQNQGRAAYRLEIYPEIGYYISSVDILKSEEEENRLTNAKEGDDLYVSAWNKTSDETYS